MEFEDSQAGAAASCLHCATELAVPRNEEAVGRELGEYHVRELIGSGGAGKVYRARASASGEEVALKILSPTLAADEVLVRRFQREAKVTAMMDHPNIVRGYGLMQSDGFVFLVMELMEGESVRGRIDRKGKLRISETLKIGVSVVRALEHARRHGIVHRDIKPGNILLDSEGRIKLADFGLVRMEDASMMLTRGSMALGSPLYSPPEQSADARNADHRSDIYALGVSLMHMLTGQHPFYGASLQEVVRNHTAESMRSGAELGTPLPAGLEESLQKMTAKLPDYRHQDYVELESEMAGLMENC
ncbi:MAG: serine/threonine-protein kinase [Limisphaerales bacterium]